MNFYINLEPYQKEIFNSLNIFLYKVFIKIKIFIINLQDLIIGDLIPYLIKVIKPPSSYFNFKLLNVKGCFLSIRYLNIKLLKLFN